MNVVCLLGRLTADPELRQTPNGTSVCSFSVAVNRAYSGANGERQADFINCVAWRQTAEFISRYFRKGNMIGLNGSIQTRTYQDKDTGKNRTAFEVIINNAYFAESKGNSAQSNQGFNTGYSQPSPRQAENNFPATSFSTGDLDGFSALAADDGDLPF
ncbi:MAG: single-stranded DNA-binding protein [Oscillospiraceae bacterium]|nr:single-stranded DNA-binding protein [Oscillospiraceae bacterium]